MSKKIKKEDIIYETRDYSIFKTMKGNRKVRPGSVRKIMNDIKRKDIEIPIIVNEKMEIMDGQHTLDARKARGLSIKYIIREGLDIQDVMRLNSLPRRWSNEEYMLSYYEQGKKEYQMLEYFVREYKLGIMFSVGLLTGKTRDPNRKEFTDGRFKITEFNRADTYAKRIHKTSKYLDFWKHDKFMRALVQCFRDPEFNWKLFYDKLEGKSIKFGRMSSRNDYLRQIEWFYNHGTNRKNRIRVNLFEKSGPVRT